ncbi:unnamed protein product, partial [Effrenium voratum]
MSALDGRSSESDGESDSGDSEGALAAFEERMAAWEAEEGTDVVFASAPGKEASAGEATRERQRRVWSLLAERWAKEDEKEELAAMEAAIVSGAERLAGELDDYGELTRLPAEIFTRTRGRLLVGNEEDAGNAGWLKTANIGAVLNCTEDAPSPQRQDLYRSLGIEVLHVVMYDDFSEDLAAAAQKARPWLREKLDQDLAVLVHCFVGGNRSVAIAVSYLILDEGLALLEALTKASARGLVLGSGSFPLQLLRLREECEGLKRSE